MALINIQSVTSDKAQEIKDQSVVFGTVSGTSILLTTADGESFSAGELVVPSDVTYNQKVANLTSIDQVADPVVIPRWYSPGKPNSTVSIAALAGTGEGTSWSPDSLFLAVSHGVAPFLTIYQRSGDTLTKLVGQPAVPPTASVFAWDTSWSPDGQYLAVVYDQAAFLNVYKRSGTTFTKLTIAAGDLPTTTTISVDFSPDGNYLAVTTLEFSGASSVIVYKRSGDTFTKLAGIPGPIGYQSSGAAFSPNGQYLSFMVSISTGAKIFRVFKRNGDVFTELAAVPQPSAPSVNNMFTSWTSDSRYVAVNHGDSPQFSIYRRDNDTFTKLPLPSGATTTTITCVAWSPDDQYLALVNSVDVVFVYQRVGDNLFPLPFTITAKARIRVGWSPDGQFMVTCGQAAPCITVIKSVNEAPPGTPNS